MKSRTWRCLILAAGLLLTLVPSVVVTPVNAAGPDYGRALGHWYYADTYDWDAWYMFDVSPDIPYPGFMPDPFSWPANYMDASIFITEIQKRLWSPTDHNRARASVLVNIMLGVDATDPAFDGPAPNRWQNGVTIAQSRWAEWVDLVNDFDAAGQANFNASFSGDWPHDWSGAVSAHSSGPGIPPTPANDGIPHILEETINGPTVEFSAPDGTPLVTILKSCANMIGLTSNYGVGITMGPDTSVLPGQTVQTQITLSNLSTTSTVPAGKVEAYRPTGGQVAIPCAGNPCAPAGQLPFGSGLSSSQGYATNSTLASGYSGSNWYWNTNVLPGSAVTTAQFEFTIPAAAPPGPFSFPVCFVALSGIATPFCHTATFTVAAAVQRYPAVSVQNGNVQAGGAIEGGSCGALATLGDIRGQLSAGSYGDYVVAASGNISNFSSNGSSNNLNLGSTGGYATMCRPDLLAAANSFTGLRGPDIVGASFSVTGKSGVYYYYGAGPLQLSGNVSGSLTIVAPNGSVLINGVIQYDSGGYAAKSLPSLGIIARDNISINAAVTRVDAYLFASQGRIDTCIEHSSACANMLTVNGFLMGRQLSLSRMGPVGAGSVMAEKIVMTPQIYLNPPQLFSVSTSEIKLNSNGEKQPLY